MTGLAGEVVERGAEEEVTERTGLLGRIGGEEGEGKKINLLGIFPALGVGILLAAADQTIIVSCYGQIGSDLHALNNTSWIATAYFLTLTSFQPLYGKLSDIFGRKPALLFAYTVFGIGCVICGLATSLTQLVVGRAVSGVGGGGMTTVVSILLSDVVPLRDRGVWQGYMNTIYATGAAVGGPLGGLLVDSIGWRWAFLGQVPMSMLAFTAVYCMLSLPPTTESHWRSKLAKIDFLGAFTLVSAIFFLLLGLDRGSNISWRDSLAVAACAISLPLFAIFILVEMKVASNPFAPGHIIFERSLFASYLVNLFACSAFMMLLFYTPLLFQAVEGMSATATGLRLIPMTIASVSGSLMGGLLLRRTGKYYWLTISSLAVAFLASIAVFLFSGPAILSPLGLIIGLAAGGVGNGSTITTTLINVIANADPKDQAVATACTYLFRSLGSVLGISVASTIVNQRLRTLLREKLDSGSEADEIVRRVRQSLEYIKELEPATREIVRFCYRSATSSAFGVAIGLMGCGLLASFYIREKKLNR